MRLWVICLAVCVFLLAALPLRWEKHEVDKNSYMMRDKWTGQWWSLHFLSVNEVPLLIPRFHPSLIRNRAALIGQEQPEIREAWWREEAERPEPPATQQQTRFDFIIGNSTPETRFQLHLESLARQQLENDAWFARDLSVCAWAALVAGFFVAAVVLYRREQAQKNRTAI
ncbi:MAG: hypothetical protein KGZ54_11840 [Dethiobacter sp.]|nr:hypothetical protein [Dethiobacter sp.]MBS3902689.1 hypothetical protein [Dethiobacter sp.]MBS3989738.1 hypothetical protein [Dethiobacter sp.]